MHLLDRLAVSSTSRRLWLLLVAALLALPGSVAAGPSPFDDAPPLLVHGYGAGSLGGRGGRVLEVTTLADRGRGSLRAVLRMPGARIIRFAVGGTIQLASRIKVREPYVTIEGQSAPEPGIQIRGETLMIATHDVIVRHVRFRPGDATADAPDDLDGLTINGGPDVTGTYNVVIDHVDALWGPDIGGIAILNAASDVTVQHSILGEGLLRSRHSKSRHDPDGHSMAANVVGLTPTAYPRRITFFGNLLATSARRVPRAVGVDGLDVINNVIYNFARGPYGNPQAMNMVNNLFVAGPAPRAAGMAPPQWLWKPDGSADYPELFPGAVYLSGNVAMGFEPTQLGPDAVYTSEPRRPLSVEPEAVDGLLDRVLSDVGAMLPVVDEVTARIIAEARDGTGDYRNGELEGTSAPDWP